MTFLLSTHNVFGYLIERRLCDLEDRERVQVEPRICKNFNLLVTLGKARHLLLKQEPHDREGKTHGELLFEWQLHEFIQKTPALSHVRSLISEAIDFDLRHSIIIFNYLNDYSDLDDFYIEQQVFPTAIAAAIGTSLATIHRSTWNCQKHKDFLSQRCGEIDKVPNFLHGLERIKPEVFSVVSTDGLKFFELYQRYESLGQAIAELNKAFNPCCLTHNDLKLNNILLHNNWERILVTAEISAFITPLASSVIRDSLVRLIDWERWAWGDPAFDLGALVGSYLKIWLSSLAINTDIDIATALSLAKTPLEVLQPSIATLTSYYLANFAEIIECNSDFLRRVVQFAGIGLIEKIRATIHYRESFSNKEICMLEVAKTLLCDPARSIPIVFGLSESELTSIAVKR
ncbi:MAG: aminoglycoside phosphotransferase family protein [Cyanosarcina radialis HA8281-LM2]|jgi:hypothetical protein|nr:aminoglycoside phosphotransferase family protein [Cyanosarcina radialis HA8281-LM2]